MSINNFSMKFYSKEEERNLMVGEGEYGVKQIFLLLFYFSFSFLLLGWKLLQLA